MDLPIPSRDAVPPEEHADHMMRQVHSAFSLPYPRKPIGLKGKGGKGGKANGNTGRFVRGRGRKQKSVFWD